jgi:hypothetical protein
MLLRRGCAVRSDLYRPSDIPGRRHDRWALTTEDFSSPSAQSSSSQIYTDVTLTSAGGLEHREFSQVPGAGDVLWRNFPANPVTFTFTNTVGAVAIGVYDLGTSPSNVTLTASLDGGSPMTLVANHSGGLWNALFFGIIETSSPFTTLTLANSGQGDGTVFDQIDYAFSSGSTGTEVPLPAAAPMLAGAIALAGGLKWRRNRRAG